MFAKYGLCSVLMLLVFAKVCALALHETDRPGLAALSSRVAAHSPHLQTDPRLPLPSAQELEAIRRVAQVLVMLGGQVIPAIIGEGNGGHTGTRPTEVPPDPVQHN